MISEPDMVFYHPYTKTQVWIGKIEVNISSLKNMQDRMAYILVEFDQMTSKLWVVSFAKDNRQIFLYKVIGDKISDEYISFEVSDRVGLYARINNDKVLINTGDTSYEIIDLKSGERISFTISRIDGKIPMGYPNSLLGFYDDVIVFHNGYYDLKREEYYYFSIKIDNPRIVINEHKIIGLNDAGCIVFYNIESGELYNTFIHRKKLDYAKYNGNDLYYLDKDILFFSKDKYGFSNIFSFLSPIETPKREWYRYDLQTLKENKIFIPSDKVILLGRSVQ